MPSFSDLPDELLVKIFAFLSDNDVTKIKLERVSKRFYGCLRESWRYSDCSLDLAKFTSTNHSAAFLARVPQINHLCLITPQDYNPQQMHQLFENSSKLRLSTLGYFGLYEDECQLNAHLITWCLSTFGPNLRSLDFSCCFKTDCRTTESLIQLLPMCTNLRHLYLMRVTHNGFENPTISEVLQKLSLKQLGLIDVADNALSYKELVELLNSTASVQHLSILNIINPKQCEEDHFVEFCHNLKEPSAHVLEDLRVPLRSWESMELVGKIPQFFPNLWNLTVYFDWRFCERYSRKEQDAGNLVKVIEEFMFNGGGKDFQIRMDLAFIKDRQSEYHFGEELLKLIDRMDVNQNGTKRNADSCNWKKKLVKNNVTVCIDACITDLYTKRKEANAKRVKS